MRGLRNIRLVLLLLLAWVSAARAGFVWNTDNRTVQAGLYYAPTAYGISQGFTQPVDYHNDASSGGTFVPWNVSLLGPSSAAGYQSQATQNSSFFVSGDAYHMAASGSVNAWEAAGLLYDWEGYGSSKLAATFSLSTSMRYTLTMVSGTQNGSGFLQRTGDPPIALDNTATSAVIPPGNYILTYGISYPPALYPSVQFGQFNVDLAFSPEPGALSVLAPLMGMLRRRR